MKLFTLNFELQRSRSIQLSCAKQIVVSVMHQLNFIKKLLKGMQKKKKMNRVCCQQIFRFWTELFLHVCLFNCLFMVRLICLIQPDIAVYAKNILFTLTGLWMQIHYIVNWSTLQSTCLKDLVVLTGFKLGDSLKSVFVS